MDPEKNQIPLTSKGGGFPPPRRVLLSTYIIKCTGVFVLFLVILYHAFPTHIELQSRNRMKESEQLLLSIPNSESALAAGRAYADHPHLAGSLEDFGDAKVILKLFQEEFGITMPSFDPIFSAGSPDSRNATLLLTSPHSAPKNPTAWIDTYYPVLKSPLDRSLDIITNDGSIIWSADLLEDGDPGDDVAHRYRTAVPPFHALSADGDVTGQLVYANYGNKEDYDELVQKGVNLTGKIVLTRYGTNVRGLKLKGAEELGAVGVLIYSDLRDDGVATVKNGFAPYPQGPARNPTAIERGSVEYITVYPGDPTTPGYPAYEDAERQPAVNIPSIPSLPISWANAQRLIEEIGDIYNVDEDGQKSLSGKTSKAKVRLVSHMETKVTPIWNTMASIPGHIRDEVVIIGCHRDAWVMGAVDPISGTVSLHEIIRSFGALIKTGWKPLRTIVFASWDAEEFGLIGSVEWGEDFSSWISEHAVAYLNIDVSVSGSQWAASASPSLANLIKQAAIEVPHPFIPGKTLWDARTDVGPYTSANFSSPFGNVLPDVDAEFMDRYEKKKSERDEASIGVYPLGSGSDFTIFLQHLGVASADETFARTPYDAVYHYHSIYDTYQWLVQYSDAGFLRHVAVAKHMELLLYRLADSIILPIDTSLYAQELDYYLEKVQVLLSDSDQSIGHGIDFSTLQKSIQRLQEASSRLDKEKNEAERNFKKLIDHYGGHSQCGEHKSILCRLANWSRQIFRDFYISSELLESMCHADAWEDYLRHGLGENASPPSHETKGSKKWRASRHKFRRAARKVSKANKKLLGFERGFLSNDGLQGREWYKHLGVAPGKWLGYGATTFPAITEALTIDKNLTLAQYEVGRLAKLLDNLTLKIQ